MSNTPLIAPNCWSLPSSFRWSIGVAHEKHAPFHRVAIKKSGQGTKEIFRARDQPPWNSQWSYPWKLIVRRWFISFKGMLFLPEVLTFLHLKKWMVGISDPFLLGFGLYFQGCCWFFSACRRGVKSVRSDGGHQGDDAKEFAAEPEAMETWWSVGLGSEDLIQWNCWEIEGVER